MRVPLVVLVLLAVAVPASAGPDLTGTWEVQSMGGDRVVSIRIKGHEILAHRVLWPEFEGEKYKLEHLYRGTISGTTIRGQLLVREDEAPKYEVLRDFDGSIESGDRITLDGLPMKRTGGASTAAPIEEPRIPRRRHRPSRLPGSG